MRIFVDSHVPQSPTWSRNTILLPFLPEGRGTRRLFAAVRNALLVYHVAKYGDAVVFGDTYPLSASIYGLLHCLRSERPLVVRADPLAPAPKHSSFWRKKFREIVLGSVDLLWVYSPSIARRYVSWYKVPSEKIITLKFHHTLTGFDFPQPTRGDYIFAGGDSQRDYATLIEAVKGLECKVVIATRRLPPKHLPQNVEWRSVTPEEFRRLMAGSNFVVLPLDTSRGSTSGQQSYLNAMALGKLVIVTDTEDASYYIENGVTGILVPSGNAQELRAAIVWALHNGLEVDRIGTRAREVALPMDQEWTFSRLLAFVQGELQKQCSSRGSQ
jgi:glycosyltransferase involved in cell wall biosynthesis